MPAFSAASNMYILSGQSASLVAPPAARNFNLKTFPWLSTSRRSPTASLQLMSAARTTTTARLLKHARLEYRVLHEGVLFINKPRILGGCNDYEYDLLELIRYDPVRTI